MILPYQDRRVRGISSPRPVPSGLNGLIHQLMRPLATRKNAFAGLEQRATAIERQGLALAEFSQEQLDKELAQAREHIREQLKSAGGHGKTQPDQQARSQAATDRMLALLSETARRTMAMRPYPVQLQCALVIAGGGIAEMATGEGKSLAAALAGALLAATGNPVHILTANDYLAARDADHFIPFFRASGCSVASVTDTSPPQQRRELYQADVIYTTGKELLGDWLRDRLKIGNRTSELHRAIEFSLMQVPGGKHGGNQPTLRGLHSVIIDEADSVLIDEAVMPLILSAARRNFSLADATTRALQFVDELKSGYHYNALPMARVILWSALGEEKLLEIADRLPRIWQGYQRCRELMTLALTAREFFLKGEHYIIEEDKLVLVDSQTGRLTPNRNLGIGLHQAVEAKEGVKLSEPTETIARFSYQRFFRHFPLLGGMSGTVRESAAELWKIYGVPVVPLPTHRPIRREKLPTRFFADQDSKYNAILQQVAAIHATGQPVLLGSRTVAVSELLAKMLHQAGLPCTLLNAVHHREEAEIIAEAGQPGAITIATNMAGRGTDIKPSAEALAAGGLFVIAVEPQRSGRLDRQLHGRSGRQGDPGAETTFAGMEDELFIALLSPLLRRLLKKLLPEDGRSLPYIGNSLIALLQLRAERAAAAQRMSILAGDDWIEKNLSPLKLR